MRILILLLVSVLLSACGKKGALVYPDLLVPAAPASVSASQTGSAVRLQFVLPDKDMAGRKLIDLAGVKISRRVSGLPQEQLCNACMADYALFLTLYTNSLPDSVQRYGNRIFVVDNDVTAGRTYSYSVAPFNKDGLDGAAAAPASISPVQAIMPPAITAESFPTEIRIALESQTPAVGSFVGYHIYRSAKRGEVPFLPVNREPVRDRSYIDTGMDRNVTYFYMARILVKLASGNIVESPVSNVAECMLKNDE